MILEKRFGVSTSSLNYLNKVDLIFFFFCLLYGFEIINDLLKYLFSQGKQERQHNLD